MNLHYCPSSSNNVGIPVSHTLRGIVSDNRSVTYPRLSLLFPSLSFVSFPPPRRVYIYIFFLPRHRSCSRLYRHVQKARHGHARDARHFIHENNPVTGVQRPLTNPFHPAHGLGQASRSRSNRSIRSESENHFPLHSFSFFFFFFSFRFIYKCHSDESDTCNCPLRECLGTLFERNDPRLSCVTRYTGIKLPLRYCRSSLTSDQLVVKW